MILSQCILIISNAMYYSGVFISLAGIFSECNSIKQN
jgi:hypothetical protein